MPFDPATQAMLEYQGRRMSQALHGTMPPDRKEAALIQRRVDDILDRRPRDPIGVTSDGEVIWPNADPWILDQLAPGLSLAVNNTSVPEYVQRAEDMPNIGDAPGGGVAVLDRPTPKCQICGTWGGNCGHL